MAPNRTSISTLLLHPLKALLLLPLFAFNVSADDMADSPEFVHAMGIESVVVDGFPVVLHYGEIRPDFEDTAPNPHRDRSSLNGEWQLSFDPEAEGIAEDWHSKPDISDWTGVEVPHCWDMMPGGRFWDWSDRSPSNPPFYDGAAWYRREFDHQPSTSQKRYRIEFQSVQQRARIFLNGTLLALHEGSGHPFSVDVSEALRSGKNTLAVQVIRLANFRPKEDGSGFHEFRPTHTQHPKAPDNWPYAGINRSVTLISENPLTVRKTQVRTDRGLLEAAICITNSSSNPYKVKASIDSEAITNLTSQTISIGPNQNRVIQFNVSLKAPVKKWSTESPNLYTLTTLLEINDHAVDTLRTKFGIRSFKTVDHQFALNDSSIFLKGVAFYEEHPERGNALLPSDHEEFFRLVEEADANFIRLHVGQRDPYVYQLADKLGVMLCAEWGGFWYTDESMGAQTEDKQSVFQSHARCTVWDLINHPSVVLWGTNNESDQFCDEYAPFLKVGRDIIETYDKGGRPITWAAWHPHKGEPHYEYADAVGFNEYRGAMDPFEDLAPDLVQASEENPSKPLIILENGAWSTLGYRGEKHDQNSEDWQADLLDRQHEVLTAHRPRLAGYTYWLLTDYRSRKTYTGNKRQNGWSRMGMYNEFSQPKLVRNLFRDLEWPTDPITDSID